MGSLVALVTGSGCDLNDVPTNKKTRTVVDRERQYFGTFWDRSMPMPFGCTPGRGQILGAGLAISQTSDETTAYIWVSCKHEDGSISINRKLSDDKPSGYWSAVKLVSPYKKD